MSERVICVAFCNRWRPVDVCFAPEAVELLHRREMSRRAMCGRLRVGKKNLHFCSVGRRSHVFGLFVRYT